jgi:hypothetical protein
MTGGNKNIRAETLKFFREQRVCANALKGAWPREAVDAALEDKGVRIVIICQ